MDSLPLSPSSAPGGLLQGRSEAQKGASGPFSPEGMPRVTQPRLPLGTVLLSPKSRLSLLSQSQISLRFLFFIIIIQRRKKSVGKTVGSNLFSRLRVLLLGKYIRTPHVHTQAHAPQIKKAPWNDLSHKSPFRAEGQASFKDTPRFPLVLFTSFSWGPVRASLSAWGVVNKRFC